LLANVQARVKAWQELDTAPFSLFYDFSDQKKKESWGTEAVLNALVLAFDDREKGKSSFSSDSAQAFANLWQVQIQTGDLGGSWDWLNFNLEPWESKAGRYHGAALAAIAVGTAPGYYKAGADSTVDAKVDLLRGYLKKGFPSQNLFNRMWTLWASAKLDGILTKEEQGGVIEQILVKQRDDGGWSLPSLGSFARSDGTEQEKSSDGYATGLVSHVLQVAGVPKSDVKLSKALTWLKANQTVTGQWQTVSVNKQRDPSTHVGKFMSDAATAYAVLALSH
jgi:squalene-hopene/tetraprenyl-beta-curcumene cyclase